MTRTYQICTRCIMDSTDPDIQFDDQGICNHCRTYDRWAKQHLAQAQGRQMLLNQLVEEIKSAGSGKEYDCIIGVSGGVDSTYLAYLVKQLGLRPLAVHLDNGWDSELAVSNVEKALKKLGIDLYTHVLDWEEFKELQIAFLKASTPDAEIPTDHAIEAVMYQAAARNNVRHIISGVNFATEGVLPLKWAYGGKDWKYIQSVHKMFGQGKLNNYPHFSLRDLANFTVIKKMQFIRLLDYVPYNRNEALGILVNELGWRYYGGKHSESIYTRFFQGYILPIKFNIDKRKAHLSTLVCSGQMTREQALKELATNAYTDAMQTEDREYAIKKLGLSEAEFTQIMNLPVKSFLDYPTNYRQLEEIKRVVRELRRFGFSPIKPYFIRQDSQA
jgi:N-acetyl sugar amidotransferase